MVSKSWDIQNKRLIRLEIQFHCLFETFANETIATHFTFL